MSRRRALSQTKRFEVFKRDGFTCQYCGCQPPRVILHVDHIVPVARGGGNEIDNLVTACEGCNQGKGARELTAAPESLAEKAARVAEAEAQLAGINAILTAKRERLEADIWTVVDALTGSAESIRRDRYQSIKGFVEKLGVNDVVDAAEIAASSGVRGSRRQFLYFCGVCWNRIRGGRR